MRIELKKTKFESIFYIVEDDGSGFPIYGSDSFLKAIDAFKQNPNYAAVIFFTCNTNWAVGYAMVKKDMELLQLMADWNAISKDKVDELIEAAITTKNYEAQIILTRYKEKIGGYDEFTSNLERFAL